MPSSSVSKSTKYFFSSAVSWDFFAIEDFFRDDCRKGDAHGSAGSRIAEAKKAHKERGQAQGFLTGLLGQIRKYVHPPAFARFDQSNQIYLL